MVFSFLQPVSIFASDETYNPFAEKISDTWAEGTISIAFLQNNFGQYTTATEMKNATDSEGLRLYFDYLNEQGKIPA